MVVMMRFVDDLDYNALEAGGGKEMKWIELVKIWIVTTLTGLGTGAVVSYLIASKGGSLYFVNVNPETAVALVNQPGAFSFSEFLGKGSGLGAILGSITGWLIIWRRQGDGEGKDIVENAVKMPVDQ